MPKKSKAQFKSAYVPVCGRRGKKTWQGRNNVGTSTMNKTKKEAGRNIEGKANKLQ